MLHIKRVSLYFIYSAVFVSLGGLLNSRPTRYGECFWDFWFETADRCFSLLQSDDSLPSPSEPRGLFPLVLNFPEKNTGGYALARLTHPMDLDSFTVCMHVLPQIEGIHTIVSYSSNGKDNELMITLGEDRDAKEVGVWIGNEFINLPHNFRPHDWANYCVTWSSQSGGLDLWINGMVGEQRHLRSGYTINPGGIFILGKDQEGLLGISNEDGFVGKMTDVNVWDYVLTMADIRDQMSCERNSTTVGNVFSWGTNKLSLYGGVQLDSEYRCSWSVSNAFVAVKRHNKPNVYCWWWGILNVLEMCDEG